MADSRAALSISVASFSFSPVCLSQTERQQVLKIAVDSIRAHPRLDRSGGLSRRSAVREVAAWLGDLCDSSVFFDFPFSQEGWAEKIHPVVVEQPTKFINRQDLMDVWLAVILA